MTICQILIPSPPCIKCVHEAANMKYTSPWWLPEGHSQTIWAARLARLPDINYCRIRWTTPDADFIDLDFTEKLSVHSSFKTVWVLFHGLEGSSASHYSRALMHRAKLEGALGVVVHFRGCSGENNLQPRAYHSGDSREMDWILRRLREKLPDASAIHVLGFSLGGNILLKWLGEQGHEARQVIASAVAVSAPVDLLASVHSLTKGFNRLYTRMFFNTLLPKTIEKVRKYPELGNPARLAKCKDFFEFDNLVTAPWHGFTDALDYYQKSSAGQFLGGVQVPTLMLNARNDPFMPGQFLPRPSQVSAHVNCMFTHNGGHVGFAQRKASGSAQEWLPGVCAQFFQQHSERPNG